MRPTSHEREVRIERVEGEEEVVEAEELEEVVEEVVVLMGRWKTAVGLLRAVGLVRDIIPSIDSRRRLYEKKWQGGCGVVSIVTGSGGFNLTGEPRDTETGQHPTRAPRCIT